MVYRRTAEAASDPVNALKAYQCSLKVVPHAFTAYNLARLAEKTGETVNLGVAAAAAVPCKNLLRLTFIAVLLLHVADTS